MAGLSKHFENTVAEINDSLGGITLEDIKILGRGHIKYMVYPNEEYMDADISALELSVRATNGIRRAGYRTISELANGINCNQDLSMIRSLGKKSIEEIMLGLFLFQYQSIKPERRRKYLEDMLALNGIRTKRK